MNRDAWIAVLMGGASAFFAWHLLSTPAGGAFVKTTTFPLALAVALLALSVALLGWSLARPAAAARSAAPAAAPADDRSGAAWRVAGVTVVTALFIAALPWLGYLVSGAIYFGLLSLLFGNRNPISIIALMILVPVALLLFFEEYMLVLLPSSRLFG